MGNLAKIAKELYDDGLKEGKTEYIKRLLTKKLKSIPKSEVISLMDLASIEKLDEVADKVFEIETWEEVEDILNK